MKTISPSVYLIGLAVLVAAAMFGALLYVNGSPGINDSFAQCLTEKGVKMYGAWWCPHCQSQKKLFGKSFKYINSIECSPNGTKTMSLQCRNEGIEGYPTWVFADGSRASGQQSFEDLSLKTNCPAPSK